ncbi:YesL family protein [Gracilibacillus sp. HCP3S3_G5_1]|uniref:YesL family protein n=1 Tax=unclassified Gracilibacillus TaxID=2625209 RepID=UPI003F897C9C
MNKGISVYITIGEWIFKILLLNLYWFIFSILGLFVAGIFPATAALFATIRQDIKSENDIKLFHEFIHYYKQAFIQSNILGYILTIAAAILLFNIQILGRLDSSLLNSTLMVMTYILLAIIALVAVFIFPIYVHYQFSVLGYIKYSAILVIGKPLHAIAMLALIAATIYLYYLVPGFIPALGVSLLAYIIMRTAYSFFATPEQ